MFEFPEFIKWRNHIAQNNFGFNLNSASTGSASGYIAVVEFIEKTFDAYPEYTEEEPILNLASASTSAV